MSTDNLKDISYFNDHPEELPENQELIDKLMAGESIPTKTDILAEAGYGYFHDGSQTGDVGARDRSETEAKARAESDRRARDAEQRAATAESTAKQLAARLSELDAAARVGKPADGDTTELEEQIDAMREDLPSMAGILDKLLWRAKASEERAAKIEAVHRVDQEADAAVIRQEVQAQIDNIPSLALWQEKHPEAWKRALEIDKSLGADHFWSAQPLKKRFEKVVRDVLEESGSPRPGPGSSRDDGESLGPDAMGDLASASPLDIAASFQKMTPAQQEAFLQRYGG